MTKANDERLWLLGKFYSGQYWTFHPYRGTKKWNAHVARMVRDGLLEADAYGNHRITERGLQAISLDTKEPKG